MGQAGRFSEASNRLFDILLFEDRPSAILDSLVRILGETLGVDRSLIYDISFPSDQAEGLTEWLTPERPEIAPTKATYPLALFRTAAKFVFATREPLESYANDPHPTMLDDGSAVLLHEQMQIQSLLWCPFSFRDDGFFLLAFNVVGRVHAWTPAEVEFVRSATRHVGMALLKVGLLREKARAEEMLLAAQKLESLGVLAGGIAHDFNNLLVGVICNAELVARRLPPDSPLQELVGAILQSGERGAGLASQLLAYAGKGLPGISHVDLAAVVETTAHLIRASMPDVQHDIQVAADLPSIACNRAQLEQVIMNLLINAAEALVDRRRPIRVRLREIEIDADGARAYAPMQPAPGRYVALEVTDEGTGVPPDTLARIFDPFFTTKFTGRGLGLSAVLGIVKSHRGAIRIESKLGSGTTFVVLWPVATSALAGVATEPQLRTPSTGGGRSVLVIDDERSVATTVAAVLDELGFTSMVGVGGLDGLARFEASASEIECVIVDLTMPPPGGREVVRRLRELRPDVPLVVMSGYAKDASDELADPSASFLRKPFLAEDLLAAIERVLASPNA